MNCGRPVNDMRECDVPESGIDTSAPEFVSRSDLRALRVASNALR